MKYEVYLTDYEVGALQGIINSLAKEDDIFDGVNFIEVDEDKEKAEKKSQIDKARQDGYDTGFDEGILEGEKQAWELALKIVADTQHNGFTCDMLDEIFGLHSACTIISTYSYDEARKKIEDAMVKAKEDSKIKIGDMVKTPLGNTGIVIKINRSDAYVYEKDFNAPQCLTLRDLQKTGKNVADKLQELFEE